MGLKQSIVVVNEYTVKSRSNGKASRGATPGDYITRYMARDLATETVAPIRRERTDDFILRYMARESATEAAASTKEIKERMLQAQGNGGVSFGYGSVSLSDRELREGSADIQRLFDEGHTVMKTVLSFDQEYLREQGLIPKDFQCDRRGDYRGQLDQMKLRQAVMHGLDRMNRAQYDDLRYIAVIQVDTEHVHCHLAMVDAGQGRLAKDGTQRGKLDDAGKSLIRRGIDAWLDEKQKVAHLSSAVGYERRNVVSFVKKWAHEQMARESTPQFLLACLPADRRQWRAGTNRAEMRKPNLILREMITERLAEPGSPMNEAMGEIQEYANTRREREGLSPAQWTKLVEDGREKIIESCMNGVYTMLRALPEEELEVRTPMLDAMSMDYDEMAELAQQTEDEDEMVDFGFRLRTYSARREHHHERREYYHEQAVQWERINEEGGASERSRVLHRLYLEEEEYHAMCAAKYQSFLRFTPPTDQWRTQWDEVAEYGQKLRSLRLMRADQSLGRMKNPEEAEMRGREIYGQYGGRLLTQGATGKKLIDARIESMQASYTRQIADLKVEMATVGLNLSVSRTEDGTDEATITAEPEYPFEQVRSMDLHHMRYDFGRDVEVGEEPLRRFEERARTRRRLVDDAYDYLVDTDQEAAAVGLPIKDVSAMEAMAVQLRSGEVAMLPSRLAEINREREQRARSRTVRLSTNLDEDLSDVMARSARDSVSSMVVDREGVVTDQREGFDRSGEGLE